MHKNGGERMSCMSTAIFTYPVTSKAQVVIAALVLEIMKVL